MNGALLSNSQTGTQNRASDKQSSRGGDGADLWIRSFFETSHRSALFVQKGPNPLGSFVPGELGRAGSQLLLSPPSVLR